MVGVLIRREAVKRIWEIMKFFLVGMIAGVPSFIIYHWMANNGYSEVVASIVSGIFFQFVNFLPQKYLTFNNTDQTIIRKQIWEFLLSGTISVVLNAVIILLLDDGAIHKSKYLHDIHKIIADNICTFIMYIISSFIFKKPVAQS